MILWIAAIISVSFVGAIGIFIFALIITDISEHLPK
jgi:hypothetical protein